MSRVIELSEEQYRALERAATMRGQTPEALLSHAIEELSAGYAPRYFETEEWFRHLGASEEQITASARLARAEGDAATDADT